MPKRPTTKTFKERLEKKYPNTYTVLGEYITTNTPIKVKCLKHNIIFNTTAPKGLLKGSCGCKLCIDKKLRVKRPRGRAPSTTKNFVEKLTQKQNNYTLLGEYVNARTKVKLKCIKHGKVFSGWPSQILRGVETCPTCMKISRAKAGRISNMLDDSKTPAILYMLYHRPTNLYKIGTTKHGLSGRYSKDILKDFEIVEVVPLTEGEAYRLESLIIDIFKNYLVYNPTFFGNGATEFFSINVLDLL